MFDRGFLQPAAESKNHRSYRIGNILTFVGSDLRNRLSAHGGFMYRFLAFALLLTLFVVASAASRGDRLKIESRKPTKSARVDNGPISPLTYRSPGPWHKVVVSNDEISASTLARSTREIGRYGLDTLVVASEEVLDEIETGIRNRIRENLLTRVINYDGSGGEPETGERVRVRDDYNALLLRSGLVDTTADEAPGTFFGFGGSLDAVKLASQSKAPRRESPVTASDSRLRIVQFTGPVRSEWLRQLDQLGLQVFGYLPNNAYLVRGGSDAGSRIRTSALASYARGEATIQWEGPYLSNYKIHPALKANLISNLTVSVAIQVVHSDDPFDTEADRDLQKIKRTADRILNDTYAVGPFRNLKLRIAANRIPEIADLENVANIEPWSPPVLFDERASQILAGALTDDLKAARGPGYLGWLQSIGFTGRFGFGIEITDTGLDRGSSDAAMLHPDFLDSSGSKVLYARDYTSETDPGDIPGHGTINASIAAGSRTAVEARDADGFGYGLGVAPFAMIGSSKIFTSDGFFDLSDPFTKLISEAYRDGARIASNSWGAGNNSYTIDSQEYDLRVRDAAPAVAGNQEMSICFAAGNSGSIPSIGSPGTAKNVISVAAGESSRKGGADGCAVEDEDADNAMDIAFFSSSGPLTDGRLKPDLTAAGTHISGAASQQEFFDATGVCAGDDDDELYFPSGQTLYTWSSGTSHSTPQVAGAAALTRQFFLNRGGEPSAAMIKAFLLNTATYMTGQSAGGNLPHPRQGWGLINMGRAFDAASKIFVDQTRTFSDSGQEFVITGEVTDPTRPFRVMVAWSDAPGFSAFAPWVNDLDLEVTIAGQVYNGNNFLGDVSQPGGSANTRDNVEAVWLPVGTVGSFVIRIKGSSISGDGVGGNSDLTDQDFALAVYNAQQKDTGVPRLGELLVSGGADSIIDPGESIGLRVKISNAAPTPIATPQATLSTSTAGVTITGATTSFASIAPGQTAEAATPLTFSVDRSVICGGMIQFQLDVGGAGSFARIRFSLQVGDLQIIEQFTDDIESGESKWTHASGVKKKKNRIDTWSLTTRRHRSGGSSWFSSDLARVTDAHLDTIPFSIPSDLSKVQLVFFHTFSFESFFDGGVLEISTGGEFSDLGEKITKGGYNGELVSRLSDNPLAGRPAWVAGRFGAFEPVVVDLTSFAGRTVVIRFRIGTDQSFGGLGWYIDDVTISGTRVRCSP